MSETTVNVTQADAVVEPKFVDRRKVARKADFKVASRMWDWIDERQIDKHFVSLVIMFGTIIITRWAMAYADAHADKAGLEVAAVMAAILAPYMALQGAAISFYFKART